MQVCDKVGEDKTSEGVRIMTQTDQHPVQGSFCVDKGSETVKGLHRKLDLLENMLLRMRNTCMYKAWDSWYMTVNDLRQQRSLLEMGFVVSQTYRDSTLKESGGQDDTDFNCMITVVPIHVLSSIRPLDFCH